jgi:hypothetical protein
VLLPFGLVFATLRGALLVIIALLYFLLVQGLCSILVSAHLNVWLKLETSPSALSPDIVSVHFGHVSASARMPGIRLDQRRDCIC